MDRQFTSHRLQSAKGNPAPDTSKPEAVENPAEDPPESGDVQPPAGAAATRPAKPKEIGGPSGPEPTRYGDWERNGICYDF